MHRMRALAVLVLVLLAAALGLYWTWPASWTPTPRATVVRRVGPPKVPAWTRRPLGITLPPQVSAGEPNERPEPDATDQVQDTDLVAYGPATLAGWVVDARGTNVAGGRVDITCMPLGPDGHLLTSERRRVFARADEDGYFEIDVQAPASCDVQGTRLDGLLYARSPSEALWIEIDEVLELDLVVPAERMGGIGVALSRRIEDGAVIAQTVHEGTPAWRAGLQPGDAIVEVNGEPVSEMQDVDDFISRVTGPEGTDVDLVVEGDDGPRALTLERSYLDSSLMR